MLDRLVAFGALFDWITPIATWIQDLAGERSVGYNISVHAGWSALAIQQVLRDSGVKTWGLTIFGEIITFRVRVTQARYAQYLMERHGIVYVGGLADPVGNAKYAALVPPPRPPAQVTSMRRVLRSINRATGKLSRI